jgi:hypothetical protein
VYAASEIARQGRDRMRKQNGTADIIRERARDWSDDEPDGFYVQVWRRFAAVVDVPGPARVNRDGWDWPLDAGARQWSARVDDLVGSFRVLSLADIAGRQAGLPSGVFVTAWWAVALAFGRRVTVADRNLDLYVWQRPSGGRAGKIRPEIWSQRPLQFSGFAGMPPAGLVRRELSWGTDLTVVRHGRGGRGVASADEPVSVLLVRFGRTWWGPLPAAGAEPPDAGVFPLTLHDVAGVIPVKGTAPVCIHELRYTPPADAPGFGWEDFPFLAAEAVAWVQRKTAELAGHVLLLGTVMPNEIALGIGIAAGQESCTGWPAHLWPVMYRKPTDSLVVPFLDVGAAVTDA